MNKKLLLLTFLTFSLTMLADEKTDSLPSNYGNWVNLTEGYTEDKTRNPQKMQVEIDGNTIHLLWAEFAKQSDETYGLWYRRSTDSGKTWEDAKLIVKTHTDQFLNINSRAINKLMTVSNGHVHVAVVDWDDNESDAKGRILYVRSDDGGASFTTNTIGILSSGYEYYRGTQIDSDGDMVVIAAPMGGNKIVYFTSKDGGDNFSTLTQTIDPSGDTPGFFDLQVSNGRWVSMAFGTEWYYSLKYGYLFITTSDGTTISTKQVAPLHSDGEPYANPNVKFGGNGNSYNYQPQMAIVDNTIHVMYRGNPGGKEESGDYNHTLYQKSEDFGETWSEVVDLSESDGGEGTIAAKGENVYVLTTASGGRRLIYYSHDGGATWSTQEQACWTDYGGGNNPNLSYSLVIAPDDTSGKHVYLTGNRYYFTESKDGFKTLAKNFVLGTEALQGGTTNYALTVVPDKNSTEHWFLQFQKPYQKEYVETDNSSQDICYRRVESEPEPSGTKALNLTDKDMIDYRVVVPMTPSLTLKKAMTVEAWVRFDSISSFQIAGTSTEATHNTSQYNGGWYMKAENWYGNGGYFEGGLRTDKSTDDVGVRIYNQDAFRIYKWEKWHHVALTYDAAAGENNARLYIDGMLVASQTVVGDIRVGANPIALGTASGYGSYGLLDHFAMFDKALTVEELREHIYNMPTGKEDGCVCLLNFDGTLKDMSGHGNDGVALLDVDFVEHEGIHPPKVDFDVAKDITGRSISMVDKSESGQAVWWYMDKGPDYYYRYVTDTTRHPGLKDLDPGIIAISMAACSDNAYAAITKNVVIGGLSKVEPTVAGQDESVGLRIYGGYTLNKSSQPTVQLRQGSTIIDGTWVMDDKYDSKTVETGDDLAYAVFNLASAPTGKYDVLVDEAVLPEAFTLEAAEQPEVWLQINGWNKMLAGKWKDFSIDYGNKSNVAAYNIPFYLFIPDEDVEVSFDFDYDLMHEELLEPEAIQWAKDSLGEYQVFEDYRGIKMRCYSFMIPYIAANGEGHKTFRIKNTPADGGKSGEVDMVYMVCDPWGPYDESEAAARTRGTRGAGKFNMEAAECMMEYLATGIVDATAAAVPFGSCVWGSGKTIWQAFSPNTKDRWSTLGTNLFSTAFSCAMDFNPLGWGWRACQLANIAFSTAMNIYGANGCVSGNGNDKKVKTVGSYDPNEMIGPSGYDDEAHYIKPIQNMAYTITYENKSTASAPAHEVYVRDTLDLSKFDAESFSFTSFGWADTTIVVGGSYTKDFTRDIKYNVNDQDIIVRVSGTFDQENGVANWSMISLDKNGKEIEDPDLGYLLPNNDNHVGEGFVTFSIDHKPTPANGSTISNKATIVFDANAPIETNTFVNTFDTDYPTSELKKLFKSGDNLVISFEGSDNTSGVGSYDIYVFKDGGEAEELALGVTDKQYAFAYDENVSYAFCVIATDHVGWKEAKDIKPETLPVSESFAITIGKNGKTTFCGDKGLDFSSTDEVKAFIATGFDKNEGIIWMTRVKDVPVGVPVMIKGTANETYYIPVTAGGTSYYENMFVGNTTGETISIGETSDDGTLTNYYMSGGTFKSVSKSANIGNNKCYLQLPTNFEAETTGEALSVKIADSGKSSFAAPYDLDFTDLGDDLKAFTATGYDKSTTTVWLTRVKKVQQGEGLMLKGTGGETYTIPSAGVQAAYVNMIKGNTSGATLEISETSDDGTWTNYYLKGGTYMKVKGSANIGNNKSYLQLPTAMLAGARGEDAADMRSEYTFAELETESMPIIFGSIGDGDGETTGIQSMFNDPSSMGNDQWYDLQGRRISKPTKKGLYIKNGKKYFYQ